MKRVTLCLALVGVSAFAQPADPAVEASLGPDAKVWQFALQCQHPAMKSNSDARVTSCVNYVRRVAAAVSAAKNTDACREAIGKVRPMVVLDAMFYGATQQNLKDERAWDLAMEVVQVGVPTCKL